MILKRAAFFALTLAGLVFAQAPPAAEQASIIEAVRAYAVNYSAALPNYTCTQTTQRTITQATFGPHPLSQDSFEEQLSVVDHRENHKLTKINGAAVKAGHTELGGPASRGEFATLLEVIFDPETKSEIKWERAGKHDGHPVNILSFRVPKSPRGYLLEGSKKTVQVPYQGLVYADSETNAVLWLEMKCFDIPASSPYDSMSLTLDYKSVPVAGQSYVLPSHYTLRYRMEQSQGTNEAEFKNYRKFTADSKITFGDDAP